MTKEEAIRKLEFLKKAYQKLIDEKVDSGKLVGDGVRGEWKAETSLDEVYKDTIDALEMAIEALEVREFGRWINLEKTKYKGEKLPFWGRYKCSECGEYGQKDFKFCPNCGARMVEPI